MPEPSRPTAASPRADAPAAAARAPALATADPAGLVPPSASADSAAVLPAVLVRLPGRSPHPVLPEATLAEAFRPPASVPEVQFPLLTAVLSPFRAETETVLLPAATPGYPAIRTAPGQAGPHAPEGPPAPAGRAVPLHPVVASAPSAFRGAEPGFAPPPVPGAFAAARAAALPTPPEVPSDSDAPPTAAIASPPSVSVADPEIPGAAELFVRLAVPQTVPDAEAEEVAGLLRDMGVGDSRVTRVGFKVSETHVRYYSSDDAAAAAALGELFGAQTRDMTSFRPRPPDGTLEIFLAGERTAPPPRVAAPNRARQQQPPDELTRMRDRIVSRLRRGEHL
jgi:hypothetical protein